MTSSPFPQELVDKIIDQFSETAIWNKERTSNKYALASLSMVARAWRERSQKHLFSVINFQGLSSIRITEAELDELGPVLSLTRDLDINGCWERLYQFDPTAKAFLLCFRNLESLSLTDWYLKWFSAEQLSSCFAHFGETVTHLKFLGKASAESLIYLTSMFPQLLVLEISLPVIRDEETRGVISREELPTAGSFQGYLYLSGIFEQHNDFLDFLSSTSPKFGAICVNSSETGDVMTKLFNSSAASLESLELYTDEDNLGANPVSLSECTHLQEVSICHPYHESIAPLLRTIRSPHLKEFIVYSRPRPHRRLARGERVDMWMRTDNELCEAYDLWAKHATGTIEVTFGMSGMESPDYSLEEYQRDLKRSLPRFTEKVAVTVALA